MTEFKDRLEQALKLRNMKPADLARLTGIGEGAISQYRRGAYKATQRNLEKISKVLAVSIPWLMGAEDEEEPTPVPEDGLNDSAKAVLGACSDFTIDEWREMLHFAEYLVSKRNQGKLT